MNKTWLTALRTALCIALLALAYVLQTSLGLYFSIWNAHIDLLPLLVAAAGIVLGPGAGLACGLAAGVLYDVSGVGVEGMYPLYYMLCGIACGELRARFGGVRGVMLCSACMVALLALLRYLFYFQFVNVGVLPFARDMAVQLVLAVALSPLALALVRATGGRKKAKPAALPPEA